MTEAPGLIVDHHGIWREEAPGRRCGILWGEIYDIGAYKLDCINEVTTLVDLGNENGEFFEFGTNEAGADAAIAALGQMLRLPDGCFHAIGSLKVTDPPLKVWRRGTSST